MTTRLAMAVVLLLVLLAQAWGLVSVWRDDPLQGLAAPRKKEAKHQAAGPERRLSLQPVSPGVPPDLNQGYLFNVERNLAAGGGKDGQSRDAGNVGIDKVQYSGAIIAGDKTKALLCYPLGGQSASPSGGTGVSPKQGFLRVVVGDTVNGYKVTEILPEKIIFSRGGQKITKFLYDRTKERIQVQAQPSTREPNAPAAPPGLQTPRQEEPRILAPRKQLLQPVQPTPSDEELRKTPLRKRPEPPKDPSAPNPKDVFKMLIEKQQQRNQALGRGEKNDEQR